MDYGIKELHYHWNFKSIVALFLSIPLIITYMLKLPFDEKRNYIILSTVM